MKTITVKVLGWAKYNPRNDIKNPTWFALSNRVLEDQDLYDLTDAEFRAFIYILSQASLKKSDVVTINVERALNVSKVTKKALIGVVDKLKPYGVFDRVQESVGTAYAVDDSHERDTTIQDTTDKTEQNTSGAPPTDEQFDFERAYKSYPRHEGKSAGMRQLAKQIKTAADFEAFETSVVHYAELCAHRKTEKKFIKLFSTFVGTVDGDQPWRDTIERPAELDQRALGPGETDIEALIRASEAYTRERERIERGIA